MGRGWWWWVEGTNVGNHQLTSSKNRHNRVRDRQTRRESISPPSPNSFFSMIRYYHQVGFSKHKYKHTNTNKHSLYSFCPRGSTRCCPSASASREQKKKKNKRFDIFVSFFFFCWVPGKRGGCVGVHRTPHAFPKQEKTVSVAGRKKQETLPAGFYNPQVLTVAEYSHEPRPKKERKQVKTEYANLPFFVFFYLGRRHVILRRDIESLVLSASLLYQFLDNMQRHLPNE